MTESTRVANAPRFPRPSLHPSRSSGCIYIKLICIAAYWATMGGYNGGRGSGGAICLSQDSQDTQDTPTYPSNTPACRRASSGRLRTVATNVPCYIKPSLSSVHCHILLRTPRPPNVCWSRQLFKTLKQNTESTCHNHSSTKGLDMI